MKKGKCRLYVHPDSRFKQIWSAMIVVFLFYVGIIMPFSVAFLQEEQDLWYYFDILTDFIFLADVFITSISAYYDDEGILITGNKQIFMCYLKGWLFVDLIASFPINLIGEQIDGQLVSKSNYI